MGYSSNVVAGAFLRVKLREIDFNEERYVCGNGHDHGGTWYKKTSPFCGQCGSPIQIVTVPQRRFPYESDLIPLEREDRLFVPEHSGMPEGEVIFVSNQPNESDRVETTGAETGFAPIAAADVDRCIQAFQRNYGDLIELIRPQVESLEVVFGVLRYAH